MGPAILIASSQSADQFHVHAFAQVKQKPIVAWIGAAHGDTVGGFTRMFSLLARQHGADTRHAHADEPELAKQILGDADLIYLGGGDVQLVADKLRAGGLDQVIRMRHRAGVPVVGISAGAIALTRFWIDFSGPEPVRYPCIGAVDIAIDVHDEESDWEELRALLAVWAVEAPGQSVDGYGIPSGGALEIDAHGQVKPLGRHPKRLRLDHGRVIE